MPDLKRELLAHEALVRHILDAFPDQSEADLADTIDGESNIKEAIAATLCLALEAEAMANGLNKYIADLRERCCRLDAKSERLRAAALQCMLDIGETKIQTTAFTVSVVQGKPKVQITGEVPEQFCKVSLTPNKTAIGDALHAGLRPTWASLGNPIPYLVIRK